MALLKMSAAAKGSKRDVDEKIKEKRAKHDAIMKGSGEPTINPLDYKLTLISALNWYNIYASPADKKKWALDSIKNKMLKTSLSKVDDNRFRQVGILLRLKVRNQYLDNRELTFIEGAIEDLVLLAATPKKQVKDTKPKNVISIQDRIKNIAVNFASEIDGEIDDFIKLGYPKTYTFKNSVKSISGQAAKLLPEMYKNQITELEEVLLGGCEQLNDSYSDVKTVQVKNFIKLLRGFVASCSQQVVSSKKIRTIKPKSPNVVVSKLKYLPTFPALDLKSVPSVKLIDSQDIWLYDTVKRKLSHYKAVTGDSMTVKGTTIMGFDVNLSKIKTIRKPELIKEWLLLSKKQILEKFTAIASKGNVPNGRTNENTILLKVA